MIMEGRSEIETVSEFANTCSHFGRVEKLNEVIVGGKKIPIYGFVFGSEDRSLPTLGLFAGVHGLERVGTHVVLNYLGPLINQMSWDSDLRRAFTQMRIVSIPIINPGGMQMNTRANPNGVDIMRNAPVEAEGKLKPFVSGHRYSHRLPWYRGAMGAEMEIETQTLVNFVRRELLQSDFSIALDVHSGFGMQDRLWYPYSRSREKFPYEEVVLKFKNNLDKALPFHVYKVEPQSESYMMHGDPWDFLFDEHFNLNDKQKRKFIPWCLEMGSWTWLKKNPKQFFFKGGFFNPILPHRYGRIMRRHKPLIDFIFKMVLNYKTWSVSCVNQKQ